MSIARTAAPECKPEQAGTIAYTRPVGLLSPAPRCFTNPDIVERGSEDPPRKWSESVRVVPHEVMHSMTAQK